MNNKLIAKSIAMILGTILVTACASQTIVTTQPAENPQLIAINNFRVVLGLPNLPLGSKGTEYMSNAPTSGLSVAIYVDSAGRRFSVEPNSNTVVEMDARDLLSSIPANAPVISANVLKARALRIANTVSPGFDSLLPSLNDNSGNKGDNYFFDWRKPISPNQMMPPFIQIGIHKSGLIFAYYNTLSFK